MAVLVAIAGLVAVVSVTGVGFLLPQKPAAPSTHRGDCTQTAAHVDIRPGFNLRSGPVTSSIRVDAA
jgi:hypothetical protein